MTCDLVEWGASVNKEIGALVETEFLGDGLIGEFAKTGDLVCSSFDAKVARETFFAL